MAAWSDLIDDLIAEILLRIPPDEPAHLVRASLVCKPWRRLLTDPAFLRRYRAFHRTPPMLGFLHNLDYHKASSSAPRFVPTTAASPLSPSAIGYPSWWCALDCRHGRILIRFFDRLELMTGAVVCAARDCDHLDCHQSPFLVVLVGRGDVGDVNSWACVYSSETGEWSAEAPIVFNLFVAMFPSLLVKDTLFFSCGYDDKKILGYNIGRQELCEIDLPFWDDYEQGIIMTAEDGGLGFVTMEPCSLVLWSRNVGDDGIKYWKQSKVIQLDMQNLFGNPRDLVGFTECTRTIFILSDVGVFAIELKSGQVKKVGDSKPYIIVLPYMSFYTPDLAKGKLAHPAVTVMR
uniref:F-box domain-containing protein n=1 Tax=Leersia perrieri TaxID=77586 RepID=A0A0D9WX99_9ORYZ